MKEELFIICHLEFRAESAFFNWINVHYDIFVAVFYTIYFALQSQCDNLECQILLTGLNARENVHVKNKFRIIMNL